MSDIYKQQCYLKEFTDDSSMHSRVQQSDGGVRSSKPTDWDLDSRYNKQSYKDNTATTNFDDPSFLTIDSPTLPSDNSPGQPVPTEVDNIQQEEQQKVITDTQQKHCKTKKKEPRYRLSKEPVTTDPMPLYEIQQVPRKSNERPCRQRAKDGTGPRYFCHVDGCDRDYSRNEHLQRHLKTHHTSEKGFTCGWSGCGKKFTRKESIRRHMKIHTGEKKFQCNVCNKKFERKDSLSLHAVVHERDRAWVGWGSRSRRVGAENKQ